MQLLAIEWAELGAACVAAFTSPSQRVRFPKVKDSGWRKSLYTPTKQVGLGKTRWTSMIRRSPNAPPPSHWKIQSSQCGGYLCEFGHSNSNSNTAAATPILCWKLSKNIVGLERFSHLIFTDFRSFRYCYQRKSSKGRTLGCLGTKLNSATFCLHAPVFLLSKQTDANRVFVETKSEGKAWIMKHIAFFHLFSGFWLVS